MFATKPMSKLMKLMRRGIPASNKMGNQVVDVYGATKKHNVMEDTWGHLYPEPGSKHPGKILVTHDLEGNTTMAGRDFPGINQSPMEYEIVCSILRRLKWDIPGTFEVKCSIWFFKNCNDMYITHERIGTLIKFKIKALHLIDAESYGY